MSRNYFHSRWNDQNWTDDGHLLRRAGIPFADVQIGASIGYWFYEKSAKGSIDYHIDQHFGGYHLSGWPSRSLRAFHGPRCVPRLKEYIDQFMAEHYPLICRWYYYEVYRLISCDTDPLDPRFKPDLDPADVERAYEYLKTIDQAVVTVENGPVRGKRAGQMALSLGA